MTATVPRPAAIRRHHPLDSPARVLRPADSTRDAISGALDAGFRHITLGLPTQPYPVGVARWVADELIAKSA
ncbi:MAG: hypothetical protein ACRDPY_40760 [Streptosporangiaceae bacterium]